MSINNKKKTTPKGGSDRQQSPCFREKIGALSLLAFLGLVHGQSAKTVADGGDDSRAGDAPDASRVNLLQLVKIEFLHFSLRFPVFPFRDVW